MKKLCVAHYMICELSTKAERKDTTAIMSKEFYSNLHQPRKIFIVNRFKKIKNIYSEGKLYPFSLPNGIA